MSTIADARNHSNERENPLAYNMLLSARRYGFTFAFGCYVAARVRIRVRLSYSCFFLLT